jgi:kynureninase
MNQAVSEEWGRSLIGRWNDSLLPIAKRLGDKISGLIGAAARETLVCDSTSINLYKAVWALLQHRGDRSTIITDAANFPTDLYVLEGLCKQLGLRLKPIALDYAGHERIHSVIAEEVNGETSLFCLSHVNYKTGYAFDLPATTRIAHSHGVPVVWDCSHGAGAVPVDLGSARADAAVGCNYKYLNSGPVPLRF